MNTKSWTSENASALENQDLGRLHLTCIYGIYTLLQLLSEDH